MEKYLPILIIVLPILSALVSYFVSYAIAMNQSKVKIDEVKKICENNIDKIKMETEAYKEKLLMDMAVKFMAMDDPSKAITNIAKLSKMCDEQNRKNGLNKMK